MGSRTIRHPTGVATCVRTRLTLLGYTVLRFDLVQLLHHPDEVLATVALALAQQRHLALR
ncbi:hypothetical protein [Microbacterium sp. bgisy203]|uniref:hypothetical protein n=1 Tax=Microbacterium sp. bgisy203 TaxID=3413799 RepID=UPI003D764EF1